MKLYSYFFSKKMVKRSIDLLLAFFVIIIFAIPLFIVAILVRLTSSGPVLYWSDRIGRYGKVYSMPKFRSMRIDAPQVATHLLNNPSQWLTPIGSFLRKSSLDELPQLWSILKGDMSFVGPRPALYNQYDLVELRRSTGIDVLIPGLTGWAQVNGRDEISLENKLRLDQEYLKRKSLLFDLYILWLTFLKVLFKDGVSH